MGYWRLSRAAAALGGLVIFLGIVIIGIFVLARLHMVDLTLFSNTGSRMLFLWMLLAIGLLDLVSGVILAYGRR